MSFANNMAPSVSEWIFRAEHESGFKNFPSRHIFKKVGVAAPKTAFLAIFEKLESWTMTCYKLR